MAIPVAAPAREKSITLEVFAERDLGDFSLGVIAKNKLNTYMFIYAFYTLF
jgi:hypothetical protein